MVVFLSGPITGYTFYRYDFKKAEETLSDAGHIVLNPAILPAGLQHEDYMRITTAMLWVCDAIYMLDGWEDSVGAKEEHELAKAIGLEIVYEQEGKAPAFKGAQPASR